MVVIYGAGKIGHNLLEILTQSGTEEKIIVCDSDKNLYGEIIVGYEINDFLEVVRNNTIDKVVVSTSEIYYEEIKNYILSITSIKVYFWKKCVVINRFDKVNYGAIRLKKELEPGIYAHEELASYFDDSNLNALDYFNYFEEHNRINKYLHYSEIYDKYFSRFLGKNIKVLEIGVYGGGSLQMWKKYFSTCNNKVTIYGIDINPECKKYEEDGIEIFIGSQDDREFLRNVKENIGEVDVIIDDGGHEMNQQIVSFEELFENLSSEGVYLCEDVSTSYWTRWGGGYGKKNTFIEYCKNLVEKINVQYISLDKYDYNLTNKIETNIKSVSFYDNVVVVEKRRPITKSIHTVFGRDS